MYFTIQNQSVNIASYQVIAIPRVVAIIGLDDFRERNFVRISFNAVE